MIAICIGALFTVFSAAFVALLLGEDRLPVLVSLAAAPLHLEGPLRAVGLVVAGGAAIGLQLLATVQLVQLNGSRDSRLAVWAAEILFSVAWVLYLRRRYRQDH